MRGFKAKALRRLAKLVSEAQWGPEEKGYKIDTDKAGNVTHVKYLSDAHTITPFKVTNTIRRSDRYHALYQGLKRDLR